MIENSQKDLYRRRRPGAAGLNHIAKTVDDIREFGFVGDDDPEPIPVRHYRMTPLEQFQMGHLTPQQRTRLQNALDKAKRWLSICDSVPGTGFLLCGPVGVGKTTIAENLMQAFRLSVAVGNGADGDEYLSLLRAALDKLPAESPSRAGIVALLAAYSPVLTTVLQGRLIEANDLMQIVSDTQNLAVEFGNARVIVVDDVGEEEIPYSNERTEIVKRQKRYGRFMDYCVRNKVHVIMTSMKPLFIKVESGDFITNPQLVEILGPKAWSRLQQMAKGFMVDLSGIPDYRPFLAGEL
ncbi:MAG: ATP-binding protein [Anaerolinea sp.]|nr:ATP-binding protein [Anaerolinea sp.]